ncbi:hypothetical protein XENTR_v10004566 [Xenopus tropicalis]|nr:hypothetical protein XENTR_v10004566 [Xenopus tropicalis]KAE8577433.1 hypothetical protein XENTR_v10004566 [Xenopus tropicalis]
MPLRNTRQLLVAAGDTVTGASAELPPWVGRHRRCSRRGLAAAGTAHKQDSLLRLCQERHFISGGAPSHTSLLQGGHSLGPLGVELRRNLLSQWWNSVVLHREQVLAIDTALQLPNPSIAPEAPLLAICTQHLLGLPPQQRGTCLGGPVGKCGVLRHELLYGALMEYVPSMELLNKKLPFGLAEIGKCFHPIPEVANEGTIPPRIGERTVASLVWFISPKSSGQWQDYWLRHRLQWWQKARDGRKWVVPHVLWVSGDLDRGLLAYLSDALQQTEGPPVRGRYQQREVLKLHPTLAPIKVAVDMGKGPTGELRLVSGKLSRLRRE